MKLSKLIEKLQKIQKQVKIDPDVIIDFDEDNGYYNLEKVGMVADDESGELLLNLKSSNES